MRTLLISTGRSSIILKRWLPNLRSKGCYDGEVLLLDYGTKKYFTWENIQDNNAIVVEKIKKEKGVTVIPAIQIYKDFFIDRVRLTREYLKENDKWKDYDVIMIIDSDDVIFYGSIQPLLNIADKHLCYVKEHFSNILGNWDGFYAKRFIKKDFDSVKDNVMINGGMVVGPSNSIIDLLDYEIDLVNKYGNEATMTCDQTFLNLFIYYHKYPLALEVGNEWNYTHAVIGQGYNSRRPIIKEDKAYTAEEGKEIFIEHRSGTGWTFWDSKAGLYYMYSDAAIPRDAEYLPFEGMSTIFPMENYQKDRNLVFSSNKQVITKPKNSRLTFQ